MLTQSISSVLVYVPIRGWKSNNILGGAREALAAPTVREFAQKPPLLRHFLEGALTPEISLAVAHSI